MRYMTTRILEEPVQTKLRERRRSPRTSMCVDLIVCAAGGAWQERTCALSLNDQGVLVALGSNAEAGQTVLVQDPESLVEREGRVVSVGRGYGRRREVAIEFTEPAPDFWLDRRRSGSFSWMFAD